MQFTYPVEVDPNTEESSPTRVQTKLCVGVLQKVSVYFPWGCAGLVGIRILHYEHQLCPTNPDEWYIGNEIFIEFESEYLILEGWNDFKVEGYNEDDFYTHTPIVSFNVLRGGLAMPGEMAWVEG
jgi:hypothetical protein